MCPSPNPPDPSMTLPMTISSFLLEIQVFSGMNLKFKAYNRKINRFVNKSKNQILNV